MAASSLLLAGAVSGCGGGGQNLLPGAHVEAVGGFQFVEPPIVRSVNGLLALELTAAIDPRTNAPAFQYNGQFVAPTIEVKPGDTIDVVYHNALPAGGMPENHTNLHFHGMEISPNPPGDDVLTTLANPGESLHYIVHVPAYELPGLYWYHTHPEGESFWQVTNGMSGAIVVDGIQQFVPALAGMREHIIVLRQPQNHPDFTTLARARRTETRTDAKPAYFPCRPNPKGHVTINGVNEAVIGIKPGESELFRVVSAAGNRYFDLALDGEPMQLVAVDGYPLRAYIGNPSMRAVDHILLPPGSRAEFIVTGMAGGTALRTRCVDTGPVGDPVPEEILVHLPPTAGSSGAIVAGDARVQQGFAEEALPPPSAFRTVRYTENSATRDFFINGKQFSIADPPMFVARAGTIEEWTIRNETQELHTFHIHQVHFVVESVNGVPSAQREWMDNVNVPVATPNADGSLKPGVVKVLLDFRDPIIRGTFVFHCHLLEHEDHGMMAKIRVE